MNRIAIVDYGMGNLGSVSRAVEECGARPVVTRDPTVLASCRAIILPGVGSFPVGMQRIRESGLDRVLTEQVLDKGIPCLGVCLGMQLMASRGREGGETEGLGWIPGEVVRLACQDPQCRIPHVGWNEVHYRRSSLLFEGVPDGKDFYFVHSYHLSPCDPADVLAQTAYGSTFASAVQRGHVFGVQFHPEKSQRFGLRLLRNFLTV